MLAALIKSYQGTLTQDEYAAQLGIAQGTLSLIYSGRRGVGVDVLRAFLQRFPEAAPEIAAALATPAGEKVVAA